MTNENQAEDANLESNAGGDQQPSVEELKAQLSKANAEAAKYRKLKNELAQERDTLKAKATSTEEDYKSLWDQERKAKESLLSKVKTTAIDSVVKAQLSKAGVLPDAIDAAAKLIDTAMVQWDEEGGVDPVSAQAAVAKLKGQYGFMFEKKVNATDPRNPADRASELKEITRAAFDKLSPTDKYDRVRKGWKIVD